MALDALSVIFFIACVMGSARAQSKVEQSEDGTSGSLKFTMPDLNDDEAHSPWVPDQLKCDACMAVSYQLWNAFDKHNKNHKYKKYNVLESDLIDITEELCADKDIFNSYGIKEINKVHHLSGPGIPGADAPGVIAGGGKWPFRLRDMCDQFMGQIGEEKVYAVYREDPKDKQRLENFLCRGPLNSVRGECSKVDQQRDRADDDVEQSKKPNVKDEEDEDLDKEEL